jgi:hypothetical protein
LFSCRNYNPIERRGKGLKDRNTKGSQKNPKSLQTNNMHNPGSGDTVGLNKASGQLVSPIFISLFASKLSMFLTFHPSHCCLLFAAIGFRQGKTYGAAGGGDSSGEVQALSKEVLSLLTLGSHYSFFCVYIQNVSSP